MPAGINRFRQEEINQQNDQFAALLRELGNNNTPSQSINFTTGKDDGVVDVTTKNQINTMGTGSNIPAPVSAPAPTSGSAIVPRAAGTRVVTVAIDSVEDQQLAQSGDVVSETVNENGTVTYELANQDTTPQVSSAPVGLPMGFSNTDQVQSPAVVPSQPEYTMPTDEDMAGIDDSYSGDRVKPTPEHQAEVDAQQAAFVQWNEQNTGADTSVPNDYEFIPTGDVTPAPALTEVEDLTSTTLNDSTVPINNEQDVNDVYNVFWEDAVKSPEPARQVQAGWARELTDKADQILDSNMSDEEKRAAIDDLLANTPYKGKFTDKKLIKSALMYIGMRSNGLNRRQTRKGMSARAKYDSEKAAEVKTDAQGNEIPQFSRNPNIYYVNGKPVQIGDDNKVYYVGTQKPVDLSDIEEYGIHEAKTPSTIAGINKENRVTIQENDVIIGKIDNVMSQMDTTDLDWSDLGVTGAANTYLKGLYGGQTPAETLRNFQSDLSNSLTILNRPPGALTEQEWKFLKAGWPQAGSDPAEYRRFMENYKKLKQSQNEMLLFINDYREKNPSSSHLDAKNAYKDEKGGETYLPSDGTTESDTNTDIDIENL